MTQDTKARRNEKSDEIMLAQFAEMHSDWRYEDVRVENALRLYISNFAFVATVVGGFVALYPNVDSPNLFWWLGLAFSPVLLALGIFTARRVKNSTVSRERRLFAINLTKRYFQDHYPVISGYLPVYVLTPQPLDATSDKTKYHDEFEQLTISFPDGIIRFIYTLNSIFATILAVSALTLIKKASCIPISLFVLMLIALVTFVITYVWQECAYRHSKSKYREREK